MNESGIRMRVSEGEGEDEDEGNTLVALLVNETMKHSVFPGPKCGLKYYITRK